MGAPRKSGGTVKKNFKRRNLCPHFQNASGASDLTCYLAPFPTYGWLFVKFSLARGECVTLTISRGWSPDNIAINDISLKLDSLTYIFAAESIDVSSTTFTQSVPKATKFGEITLSLWLLRSSRSSKVIEFGTNRKLICDFLLVINRNLAPILHRFRDIAFDRSKIAIFGYPSCV